MDTTGRRREGGFRIELGVRGGGGGPRYGVRGAGQTAWVAIEMGGHAVYEGRGRAAYYRLQCYSFLRSRSVGTSDFTYLKNTGLGENLTKTGQNFLKSSQIRTVFPQLFSAYGFLNPVFFSLLLPYKSTSYYFKQDQHQTFPLSM